MITIYTNETCPYCKAIKEQLDNNKIEYNERLTKDWSSNWQSITALTGMPTVPTIEYMNEYFVPGRDFQNPQQLMNILETFKNSDSFINDYDYPKRTLERIKTLNFNINTAFGRMDKLLKQIETKINTDEHESTD
tara:strand:+ start:281 stop:685 length:405 start_codon:yes stop_codon:yes gene_type:complete